MNYSNIAKKTINALKKNGVPCYILRQAEEYYDPATNEYITEESQVSGYALVNNYNQNLMNGNTVLAGDVNIMAVLDLPPDVNETIHVGDKTFTIVNVNPFCPDGMTNIYYDIQGR